MAAGIELTLTAVGKLGGIGNVTFPVAASDLRSCPEAAAVVASPITMLMTPSRMSSLSEVKIAAKRETRQEFGEQF